MLNICVLDAATLGEDLDLTPLSRLGQVKIYQTTTPEEVGERLVDCDVVLINKIRLGAHNLKWATRLKLICVAATGYDNIDVAYCRAHGIGVANVVGYSTNNVAQLTVAMALSLLSAEREDPLPAELRERRNLCTLAYAEKNIHCPTSFEALAIARRRLVYEEFFLFSPV